MKTMLDENLYNNIIERTQGFEQRTLERIGARIKKTGKINSSDIKALNNIANIKGDISKIQEDLQRITTLNNAELVTIYKQSITSQNKTAKELANKASKNFAALPYKENKAAQRIVNNVFTEVAKGVLNFSNASALGVVNSSGKFISLENTYKQAVDKAIISVTSGTTDFNTAMRDTIQELGGSGLRVQYGNSSRRLDSAIRQNMLWGNKQVYQNYDKEIGQELGCDGIEIDFSSNPRDTHISMQGNMYSLNGAKTVDGVYYPSAEKPLELLEEFGCNHTATSVILGISEPSFNKKEIAERQAEQKRVVEYDGIKKDIYSWSQVQRNIETEIRKNKDIAILSKASGDTQLYKTSKEKIESLNAKYNDLTKNTGLQAKKERASVVGYK